MVMKKANGEWKFEGEGLTKGQKLSGHARFKKYLKYHNIESFSDAQLLEELVYREIQHKETKEKIQQLQKSDNVEEKNLIPKNQWRALDDNLDKMIEIKERLGLFEKDNKDSFYKKYQLIKKKFKKWLENRNQRPLKCPWCSKMLMLNIKMDCWQAKKHPYFKDRILANEHMWRLWREDKITKDDIAKILGVSADYVDFIEENLYKGKDDRKNK